MAQRASKDAVATGALSWDRFRGRCGGDDPATLPADMGAEGINWTINAHGLGQRRHGSSWEFLTGAYVGYNVLARFIPGNNEALQELHFIDDNNPAQIFRVAAGTAAIQLGLIDAIAALPQQATWTVGNGKLFWAYKSGLNRLHVYDPATSASTVYRAGLLAAAAPTLADFGSGSYPATTRYYRLQTRRVDGGVTRAISNLSPSTVGTPSGTGAGLRIIPSGQSGERDNEYRVFGSTDNVLFYQLSDWVSNAVPFEDTRLVSAYASLPAAPLEGSNFPPPAARFILWDGTRLLMFGSWGDQAGNDLPAVNGRVYFTRPLDATADGGDDMAVEMNTDRKGYLDCNRDGNAEDRALVGPVDGAVFAMQSRGIHMLKQTSAAARPYTKITLSRELGAVSHQSSFVGEDETGAPCVYWLDGERGPYRYGRRGIEWCGYDVLDEFRQFNPDATILAAHGFYDPHARRCYWFYASGTSNEPNAGFMFQVQEGRPTATEGVRYGWTLIQDIPTQSRCSVIFSETFGSPMSRKVKPYLGYHATGPFPANLLLRADDPTMVTDGLYPFHSHITSKAWLTADLPKLVTLDRAWVRAPTQPVGVIYQQLIRNYGDEPAVYTATELSTNGPERRRVFQFEDAHLAGAWTFQTQLGDIDTAGRFYAIDRWQARMTVTDLEVGTSEL